MMQAPWMMHPGMMTTHTMPYTTPGICPPIPPSGLVNLDVNVAPGLATLDTEYPHQLGFSGMGTHMDYSQMISQTTYTVQKGDTVYKIARRFGTTMNAIIQANNLSNPNLIFPGQVLYIA
jgi:FOG: LysM repeat